MIDPVAPPSAGSGGRRHDDYGPVAVEQLVRAIVPRGQNAATYAVLVEATRAAISVTSARADGLVYPDDVLAILRAALDAAAPRRELDDNR